MFTKKIFSKILVRMSSPSGDPHKHSSTKATNWSAFLLGFSFLIFCSCSTTKTLPVETIKKVTKTDTLYINNVQYDSIYISQDKYTDRSRDTILIKETNTEYRYKLLRDTIERVKIEVIRDSIPYEIRITEIKQVKHIPWIKPLAVVGIITILVQLIYIFTKLKRF